jgi:hypothetical protein
MVISWWLFYSAIAGSDFDQLTVHLGQKIGIFSSFVAFFCTYSIQNGVKVKISWAYLKVKFTYYLTENMPNQWVNEAEHTHSSLCNVLCGPGFIGV